MKIYTIRSLVTDEIRAHMTEEARAVHQGELVAAGTAK
jgi:hypothetical protein